jgi:hypothetical protein
LQHFCAGYIYKKEPFVTGEGDTLTKASITIQQFELCAAVLSKNNIGKYFNNSVMTKTALLYAPFLYCHVRNHTIALALSYIKKKNCANKWGNYMTK